MTPSPEVVQAALDKITAASQVASGRQEAFKTAQSSKDLFLTLAGRERYHDALVELHQTVWEWLFLTTDPKNVRRP
jgi:hypothetical protein